MKFGSKALACWKIADYSGSNDTHPMCLNAVNPSAVQNVSKSNLAPVAERERRMNLATYALSPRECSLWDSRLTDHDPNENNIIGRFFDVAINGINIPDKEIRIISTVEGLNELKEKLLSDKGGAIAIDVETGGGENNKDLALIQVGIGRNDQDNWIIDPLCPGDDYRQALKGVIDAIFEKTVIYHGGGGIDVLKLNEISGTFPKSIWDTDLGARMMGFKGTSYGVMVPTLLYGAPDLQPSKKLYQCSSWAKRPLNEGEDGAGRLRYAMDDTKYLPSLCEEQKRSLDDLPPVPLATENPENTTRLFWAKEQMSAELRRLKNPVQKKKDPDKTKANPHTPEELVNSYLTADDKFKQEQLIVKDGLRTSLIGWKEAMNRKYRSSGVTVSLNNVAHVRNIVYDILRNGLAEVLANCKAAGRDYKASSDYDQVIRGNDAQDSPDSNSDVIEKQENYNKAFDESETAEKNAKESLEDHSTKIINRLAEQIEIIEGNGQRRKLDTEKESDQKVLYSFVENLSRVERESNDLLTKVKSKFEELTKRRQTMADELNKQGNLTMVNRFHTESKIEPSLVIPKRALNIEICADVTHWRIPKYLQEELNDAKRWSQYAGPKIQEPQKEQ